MREVSKFAALGLGAEAEGPDGSKFQLSIRVILLLANSLFWDIAWAVDTFKNQRIG